MNFLSRLFARRQVPQPASIASAEPPLTTQLLTALLSNELERKKLDIGLEQEKHKLDIERTKIELENLQLTAEEKRKDLAFKADLRAKQREWQANHRARKKIAGGQVPAEIPPFMRSCEECMKQIENRKPHHDHDIVKHAVQQHPEPLARFLSLRGQHAINSDSSQNLH
jgi:hypothetical protein